jgi:hypothetical protein
MKTASDAWMNWSQWGMDAMVSAKKILKGGGKIWVPNFLLEI